METKVYLNSNYDYIVLFVCFTDGREVTKTRPRLSGAQWPTWDAFFRVALLIQGATRGALRCARIQWEGFPGNGRVWLGGDPKHAGMDNKSHTKLPTEQLGGAEGCGLGAGSVGNFVFSWSRIRKWMHGWMLLLIPARQTRINTVDYLLDQDIKRRFDPDFCSSPPKTFMHILHNFKTGILPSLSFSYARVANYIFVTAVLFQQSHNAPEPFKTSRY